MIHRCVVGVNYVVRLLAIVARILLHWDWIVVGVAFAAALSCTDAF